MRGGVVQSRGDWAHNKTTLNLTGWRDGPERSVCWKCKANGSDIPFTDASLTALWRSTHSAHCTYMADSHSTGKYVSQLFSLPGFQLEYVSIDLMHCCDLGCAQFVLGNIMWELFRHIGGIRDKPDEHIADLILLIKQSSRHLGMAVPPINALTLTMFRVSS